VQPDPIREFFLKANPNPAREGCPGERVLRAIAANELPESDPARLHLASCSPCFAEFRAFKESLKRRRQKVLTWLVAVCLLTAVGIGIVLTQVKSRRSHETEMALVDRTVDLSNYGALRGGGKTNRLEALSLPSARVRVTIVLPKLSDPGTYTISVTRDQTSGRVLTSATGAAQGNDRRRTVTVPLDLRNTQAGSYFLATTHEQEEASYFYPLKIN
jgi:hypothetical protein